MIDRAVAWIEAQAVAILGVLLVAALIAAGLLFVQLHGFKVGPLKFEGALAANERLRLEVAGSKMALDLSEDMRADEQAQAQQSFNAATERCEQRVDSARDAGRAIQEIVTYGNSLQVVPADAGHEHDAAGAGNRGIVPAGQLRRVIGQAAAGGAAGMSGGSNGGAAK